MLAEIIFDQSFVDENVHVPGLLRAPADEQTGSTDQGQDLHGLHVRVNNLRL